MMNVFQRAFVRAGVDVEYSRGFNPRPSFSLPLPRSVGVESEEELLSVRVKGAAASFDSEGFARRFSSELPLDCEFISVEILERKVTFQAVLARYVFTAGQQEDMSELRGRAERLLAMKRIDVDRRIDAWGNVRTIDVRGYLKTIEIDDRVISVECNISPAGTIRVDEILRLLELDAEKLAAPIRRTNIKWIRT
jgi:radical SAM-linked protein